MWFCHRCVFITSNLLVFHFIFSLYKWPFPKCGMACKETIRVQWYKFSSEGNSSIPRIYKKTQYLASRCLSVQFYFYSMVSGNTPLRTEYRKPGIYELRNIVEYIVYPPLKVCGSLRLAVLGSPLQMLEYRPWQVIIFVSKLSQLLTFYETWF